VLTVSNKSLSVKSCNGKVSLSYNTVMRTFKENMYNMRLWTYVTSQLAADAGVTSEQWLWTYAWRERPAGWSNSSTYAETSRTDGQSEGEGTQRRHGAPRRYRQRGVDGHSRTSLTRSMRAYLQTPYISGRVVSLAVRNLLYTLYITIYPPHALRCGAVPYHGPRYLTGGRGPIRCSPTRWTSLYTGTTLYDVELRVMSSLIYIDSWESSPWRRTPPRSPTIIHHVSEKKPCHFIVDDSSNKKCNFWRREIFMITFSFYSSRATFLT